MQVTHSICRTQVGVGSRQERSRAAAAIAAAVVIECSKRIPSGLPQRLAVGRRAAAVHVDQPKPRLTIRIKQRAIEIILIADDNLALPHFIASRVVFAIQSQRIGGVDVAPTAQARAAHPRTNPCRTPPGNPRLWSGLPPRRQSRTYPRRHTTDRAPQPKKTDARDALWILLNMANHYPRNSAGQVVIAQPRKA